MAAGATTGAKRWVDWADAKDQATATTVAAGELSCFGDRLTEAVVADLSRFAASRVLLIPYTCGSLGRSCFRSSPASSAVCFNCGVVGQYQVDSKLPPSCRKCKSSDHPALLCPKDDLSGELALCGHALKDFGYYQLEISEPPASPSLMTLIFVLGRKTASPAIIAAELQHPFRPDWDWVVTSLSDHEYFFILPDPASLWFGTHSDEPTLALNKLIVNILVPEVDPLAGAVLEPVWI
ncbi:hypothetical protein ZWY2020_058748 [Hordeum vulgare]|nr:hypothetical protein ZWY2020_058748 [Hordeum vulgare]